MQRHAKLLGGLCLPMALLLGLGQATPAHGRVALGVLADWGVEVYEETTSTLGVPGTRLYAETASLGGAQSGGINGRAFVWPAGTQFRVFNSLAQLDPVASTPVLREFSDQLRDAYWDDGYRSGAGAGDRFYDDNAHLVVSLSEAYDLTGDPVYLDRAIETYGFVLEGEDSVAGGGIYFKQNDFSSKDTISTLQGARAAAILYQQTSQPSYLDDAVRLLDWAESHVQQADGLFNQGYVIANNAPGGVAIVNSAGIGISANLELYRATGGADYLGEAQRIATKSLERYFDSSTGRINDEGFWAFELVEALNDLYLIDSNPLWITRVKRAMAWLHDNKSDPNGHYGLFWGRNGPQVGELGSWSLNEQASVARAFLDTSLTILPGDINQDSVINSTDVTAFINGWLSDTTALTTQGKLRAGDLNLDGLTDVDDFFLLRGVLNDAGVAIPQHALQSLGLEAPEPTSGVLGLIGCVAAACGAVRRR